MSFNIAYFKITFFALLFFIFSNHACFSQTGDDWFSFDIPPLDTAIPDFYPVFNQPPIGDGDFVTVNSEGHFEVNGEEIRFWGTPCSRNESGSLSKSKFPEMVKELKKNGVNIIRFHLWDSEDFNPGTSYFGGGPGTRELDSETLDRLDYLISLLKENGIYAYIDLLCDREYTDEDGVYSPDSTYQAAKIVNFFDPELITLQKEFARKLLTHVNPYTGNSLVDEPTMAIIDIVNEGWLFHALRSKQIRTPKDGGILSYYHYDMLTNQWNDFLLEKYETTEAINDAWGTSTGEMLSAGGFETWDTWLYWSSWGPASFTLEQASEAYSGDYSFHVFSPAPSANDYDCQLQYNESFFQSNSTYELKFRAKSDNSNKINYAVQIGESPWTTFSSGEFSLTTEWVEYTQTITIEELSSNPYLLFNLGSVDGNVWIDDVSVKKISSETQEIFEWYYIEDIAGKQQRKSDQAEFLITLQEDYYAEIYNYLKDSLGVKIPVTGSNYLTGPTDIAIQSHTDFIDNHGYWASWSAPGPVSMIPHTDYYNPVLGLFAASGVPGKPYTVSEYNYQFVNYYAYESLFFLTAYGSFHEADMLMVHGLEYNPFWDFMWEGFNGYTQISYRAMQPTMAYAYRNKLIAPAQQTVEVEFNDSDLKAYVYKNNPWDTDLYPDDYPFKLAYQHKVRIKKNDREEGYQRSDYPTEPANPYLSDTEEIEWDNTGLFSVNAPQLCAFVGDLARFGGKTVGNVTLDEADNSAGFTLIALDNKPIGESEKMGMTITTQMKNTGMVTNGFNVLDHGEKPRIVEAARIKFNLETDMEKITVFWLDESGHKSDYYEVFENNGNGNIPVTINTHEHPGVWFGVKKYSESLPVADFSADTTSGETPLVVHFTDESTDAELWEWDFNNDGIIDSHEQNPTYTYTEAGSYSVSLTAKNPNGEDTKTREDYMDVSQGPIPVYIRFQVDMQNETVSPEGVFLSGSFNDWEALIEMEANGTVYMTTYELMSGDSIYYRFFNGETGEIITGECNAEEDNSRMLVVPAEHSILDVVCFGTCDACVVNAPPVADAGENQTVDEGQTVTLDGSGSYDPDGESVTYQWTAPEGITLSSANVEQPTFAAPEVIENTDFAFTLVVNDGIEDSDPDEVTVTVRNVNLQPVADAGENQTVDEGQTVTLDGSGSYDPDGDLLTFEWKAPEGVTLSSETDESPTFEAPEVEEEQILTFSLRVHDGFLFSPYSETSVTVRDVVGTEITERNEIALYPNPSNGKIRIETGSTEQNMKVEIVDLTGQIVYQTESNTIGMQQFDLSELNSGIYLVCIGLNHKKYFKKLIINK